jgi:glycosyltransferase involved in cell wall biosynthesis
MKVAIDVSPLSSDHKVRGVGFYLKNLQQALLRYFPQHDYTFFTKKIEIPKDTDVIHYPYFDPFFISLPLINKAKTVVTVHDMTPLLFPNDFPSGLKGQVKWWIQKRLLQGVDAIITDSRSSKKDIATIINIPKEKIFVSYLAAGEEFKRMSNSKWQMSNIKHKYHLPENFALYVGDATANKNLPRIVKAALLANVPLVLVGKAIASQNYDRDNPWNKDLIEVQGLIQTNTEHFFPLGFVGESELVNLYHQARVFVMPSLYEGFGLPILEAMSCGCPVVTSKEGSLPEVAGDAALYVDAYSIESIAGGLQQVISDKKSAKELREKGLQQSSKFSWKQTAKETIDIYTKVLSS